MSSLPDTPRDYETKLKQAAARLQTARRVAIFTHQRPDPDAIGSQTALACALVDGRAHVEIIALSQSAPPYEFLYAGCGAVVKTFDAAWARDAGPAFDTIAVVDTCAYQQLEPAQEFLRAQSEKIVVLDHHHARDPLSSMIVSDISAAACVEIVADLMELLHTPLNEPSANALLAGLVGDTGWFRFDSVTPRTHRLAARCVEAGARPASLYAQLSQQERPSRLRLMQRALESMVYFADEQATLIQLTKNDFDAAGAAPTETEGLVDLPMQLKTVEASALLSEMADGRFRANLRSKTWLDVNAIGQKFGGGGHVRAAGCRIPGPAAAAATALRQAISDALNSRR